MKTIWKFELIPGCALEMPAGAKILSVGVQGNSTFLWALVDPDSPRELRHFVAVGIGFTVPNYALQFLGTVHHDGGASVFHIFEFWPK